MNWPALVDRMDRACMKHLDDVEIFYTPAGGAPVPVEDGIFDGAYVDVTGGEAGFGAARPMVFCRAADLPEDPDQELLGAVTVNDVAYAVEEVRKDAQGGVRLFLHAALAPYIAPLPGAPEIDVVED